MLDRPDAENFERTRALVARILARRDIAATMAVDGDLRESGLTSLDMVALMLAVECEYGVTIPQSAMTPQNFRSIRAIETLVAWLLDAQAAERLPSESFNAGFDGHA
jgi:acyl carrier protein